MFCCEQSADRREADKLCRSQPSGLGALSCAPISAWLSAGATCKSCKVLHWVLTHQRINERFLNSRCTLGKSQTSFPLQGWYRSELINTCEKPTHKASLLTKQLQLTKYDVDLPRDYCAQLKDNFGSAFTVPAFLDSINPLSGVYLCPRGIPFKLSLLPGPFLSALPC